MRYYLVLLFAVVLLSVPWFASNYPAEMNFALSQIQKAGSQLAAIILAHNPKTVAQIQDRYHNAKPKLFRSASQKVRILLVPGHEPSFGGAEYGSLKERNMTVELAENLRRYLSESNRYEVFVSRDTSAWNLIFADYFKNNAEEITAWQKGHKAEIVNLTRLGQYKPVVPSVFHNSAPDDVAMRLYGIDKWSNDNDIDIVIHIHFNDYPRSNGAAPGEYTGFTIYVPERQYLNSTTTFALAETVFSRLEKYNAISNLPGEKGGIVEDQDLIAVGSYNSVNAASMLIEYGYIYEPQFTDEALRSLAIKDLAFQTYIGLQDFFDSGQSLKQGEPFGTSVIPHSWIQNSENNSTAIDAFALQTALLYDGVYPPNNKSKNDCPRSGKIGLCTKDALGAFQDKYEIKGEKGKIGPRTLQVLNHVFGAQPI